MLMRMVIQGGGGESDSASKRGYFRVKVEQASPYKRLVCDRNSLP